MRKWKGSAAGLVAGVGAMGLVALSLGAPDGCGASSEGLIGPEGGVLRSADGRFELEIPEGALESAVEVSVHVVDCQQPNEADCYEVMPRGLAFRGPATATYEAAELMAMESVTVSTEGQDGWQPLADLVIDRENETVTASMLFLSAVSVQAN